MKKFLSVFALGLAFLGTQAFAANVIPNLPTSLDTTNFLNVAGLVVVALAVMWAVKKAIGLVRV